MVLIFAAVLVWRAGAGRAPSVPHPRHTPPRGQETGRQRSQPEPLGIPGDWRLILDSSFSGGSLDSSLWRTGWFGSGVTGPINVHESACYSPANVRLSRQGTVDLSVSASPSRCGGRVRPFTGAVLSTNPHDGRPDGGFTYRYGVLEARIFVPATAGGAKIADWPAVLTLGQVWPRDGEDDVMENLGGLVCSHFHSPGFAPGGNLGGCDPSFTPGWHTVASDWEPGSVTWYYDGIEVARATEGITSAPMYLVLVNTVSAKSPEVARPDALRVAYVRVWKRATARARSRTA